ncbi:hypothetical protein GS870_23640, partial [Rhodococcus hoagii]|nr:hypothetical protein [Prescottella equi]
SKSTVTDLEWLRRSGIGDALIRRAQAGGAILGICVASYHAGHGDRRRRRIRRRSVDGLGLLDLEIAFAPDKVLAQFRAMRTESPCAATRSITAGAPQRRRPVAELRGRRQGGQCARQCARHPLARDPRERRVPATAAHRGGGNGRTGGFRRGTGPDVTQSGRRSWICLRTSSNSISMSTPSSRRSTAGPRCVADDRLARHLTETPAPSARPA